MCIAREDKIMASEELEMGEFLANATARGVYVAFYEGDMAAQPPQSCAHQ